MAKIVSVKMTPAIVGGNPIRKKPFPVKWPVVGPEERRNLLKVFDKKTSGVVHESHRSLYGPLHRLQDL